MGVVVSRVIYYSKVIASLGILSGSAAYGIFASIVCRLVGKPHLCQWTAGRCFYGAMRLILGIDVKIINEEKLVSQQPCVIVSNHQSSLDVLMLGKAFPKGCTITAKKSLKYVPVLGWFMSLSNTYFLQRNNRKDSMQTLQKGLQDLAKGRNSIWVFPEGTRSHTTSLTMLPFKKGAFHIAQQGGFPIVPVVVSNTSKLVYTQEHVYNRGCIVVKVLDPIPTANVAPEEVDKLAQQVRQLMVETLENDLGYSPCNAIDTDLPSRLKLNDDKLLQNSSPDN